MFKKKPEKVKVLKKGLKVYINEYSQQYTVNSSNDCLQSYIIDKSVYDYKGDSYYLLKSTKEIDKYI